MRLGIRGHPIARMEQRGITRADIESAIAQHHTRIENETSITYVGPGVNGDDLKVWTLPPGYVDDDTTITIKSAAWKGQEDPK